MIKIGADIVDELLNQIGVYLIINLINGKQYIGSTGKSFISRFRDHTFFLKSNKHENKHLQNAFNKYGGDNFEFRIREICDNYLEREQEIFDTEIFCLENHSDYYYNINPIANRPPIRWGKRPAEVGKKISKAKIGHSVSPETREKLRQINLGKTQSSETVEKCRVAMLEKKRSGSGNPNYISPILVKNIQTNEEFEVYSEKEAAKIIGVGRTAINNRLNENSKKLKNTCIKNIWLVCRIIEND